MDDPTQPPPSYSYLDISDSKDTDRPLSPNPGPQTPRRGSDESSTARSEYYGSESKHFSTRGHSTRLLEVFHTDSHRNYRITTSDNTPVYYVNNSHFKPQTPDVTLQAGSDKIGKVLGVAKFSTMFSKQISIGLGDPNFNGGRDMTWLMMERTSSSLVQSEFKFNMKIHQDDPHARTFVWKRSSAAVVGDDAAHSLQNFKLLDEENGEIVATFANNGLKSWKKKGKFRIVEGLYGTEWEKAALLTGLCLIERARRRQRASRAGSGAGAS
jgi:hypothetical protein